MTAWNAPRRSSEAPAGQPLLIVGASVRAAAQSSARAGFQPFGADLFADWDLQACGPWMRIQNYPRGISAAIAGPPHGAPWFYTGALENYPELIDRWAQRRPLLGVQGESLRRVRDPLELHAVLSEAGIPSPAVSDVADGLPGDGSWLRKPRRSAGGARIFRWQGPSEKALTEAATEHVDSKGFAAEAVADAKFYYQQRVVGTVVGAVYLATTLGVQLLGVTQQLCGADWLGAKGFRYCGSIGPLMLAKKVSTRLETLGRVVSERFALRGLFGIDAILDEQGVAWPIEVNPRYTASIEVLERSCGFLAIAGHVAAFTNNPILLAVIQPPATCWAKGILFVPETRWAPGKASEVVSSIRRELTKGPRVTGLTFADCPAPAATIEPGWPLMTALASGRTAMEAETTLREAAAMIMQAITQSGGAI